MGTRSNLSDHILYRVCDRIRPLLLHKVTRTGDQLTLPVFRPTGEVDLEAVPFRVNGVELLRSQPRKCRMRRCFGALENNEGNVRVPCQLLMAREKPVFL